MKAGSRSLLWLSGMLAITLVTIIWGYGNVVIRQGEMKMSPSILLWLRFGASSVLLLPVLIRLKLSVRTWLIGLGTGGLLGLSVLAQGWSMMTISVDASAFITALYVVITPVVVALLQRRWPQRLVFVSVLISLCGVALLVGHLSFSIHIGLLFAFIAAVGLALQIVGTTELTKHASSIQITALLSVGSGAAMTVWILIQGWLHPSMYHGLFHWSPVTWIWVAYLVLPATVIACFLQAWGQRYVSSTDAALAFNLEPVWTAVFAWFILNQQLTWLQMVGGILIIGSLMFVSRPAKQSLQSGGR